MANDATTSRLLLPLVASGTVATANSVQTLWQGGRGYFAAESSSWGGGSVKLQWRTPNGTYIDIDATNLNFTANGVYGFEAPPGELKAAVTHSPTALYAWAFGTRIS